MAHRGVWNLKRLKLNKAKYLFTIFLCLLTISTLLLFSLNVLAQSEDLETVFFDSDTNSISEESQELLNRKAESLNDGGDYTITLEGYSDITGKADYNLELSRKRAQLVKDYLVDLGIDPSSIEVVGKGGTEKYGSGDTNEALEQNRRVNLIVDIPFVPAIELIPEEVIEPQEIESQKQNEPEATQQPEATQEPEVTQEPIVDNIAEDSYEVEATPIPVPPISGEALKSIEKHIRQNASEGIIFITPREMQIGQTYKVEAEVSSAFIEAISKDLQDWWFENKIGLSLMGNTFDITTQSQDNGDLKIVGKDAPAIWEWDVIPNHGGINSLVLAVVINVKGSENQIAIGEFATFQRVVDVEPNLLHSITSSYWIMGILSALIISVVAWILIRKVRIN